jgi:phosphoglycolate phosphatase-like HAD superfamily hydrolase
MLTNIIWDVDGTLFDTYPAIAGAFQAALHDLGHDAPLDRIMELAKISLGHCATTLIDTFHVDSDALDRAFDTHYNRVTPADQPPFPEVIAICELICARGGKNVIITHRGKTGTDELLQAHAMTGYFSGSLTRADGYPRKPDPAAFIAALRLFDLRPDETLTVGDRDIDILAGQAAGITTCLFDARPNGSEPDRVIGDFRELMEWLEGTVRGEEYESRE